MNVNTLRKNSHRFLVAALACASLASPRTSSAVGDTSKEAAVKLAEAVRAKITKNERVMFVVTDKPLYRPGETIWLRAFETLRKDTKSYPAAHDVTVTLLAPSGGQVVQKQVAYRDGVAASDIDIAAGLPGGKYILRAEAPGGIKSEVAVTISNYEIPRIKKTLTFTRASYASGDYVVASVDLKKATGEALITEFTVVVIVDGAELTKMTRFTNKSGKAKIGFRLPATISTPDARLNIQVSAGGATESIERRIPIALDGALVSFFPEGGDLVSGLASNVYLAATDSQGEPIEVEGTISDDQGKFITNFRSAHEGMARFALTPATGRQYVATLTKPTREKRKFALPAPKADGCTMRTLDGIASESAKISLRVACTSGRKVLGTAVLRESLVGNAVVDVPSGGEALLELSVPQGAQGAVRTTLFSIDKEPLAERLVYRGRSTDLEVKVTADRSVYSPRDEVVLTVDATDKKGNPVAADFALAVVDDGVLSFADDTETAKILAAHYLLPEMPGQTISKPNFYFSTSPKAGEALDLLLGTKGYRRFAWAFGNTSKVAQ